MGIALLLAAVLSAITLSVTQGNIVGRTAAKAICELLTLGQGNCGPLDTSSSPEPSEPCTVKSSGYAVNGKVAALNFTGGGTKATTIEKMSNGRYQVTVTSGSSAGLETGVGWDARVKVNGTQWGLDASAAASLSIEGAQSQVYIVDSQQAAESIRDWAIYDQSFSTAVDVPNAVSGIPGGNSITDHIVRPISDWVAGKAGLHKPPSPESVVVTGGVSAEASALATALVEGAGAEVGVAAVGSVALHKDGSVTITGTAEGTAELAGAIATDVGQIGGKANMGFVQEFDPKGNLASVSYTYGTETGDGITMNTYRLPITTTEEKALSTQFLINPNPSAWKAFSDVAKQRGEATRVTYETSGLDVDAAATIRAIEQGGVQVGFALPASDVKNASYYDGTSWQPWTSCAG